MPSDVEYSGTSEDQKLNPDGFNYPEESSSDQDKLTLEQTDCQSQDCYIGTIAIILSIILITCV